MYNCSLAGGNFKASHDLLRINSFQCVVTIFSSYRFCVFFSSFFQCGQSIPPHDWIYNCWVRLILGPSAMIKTYNGEPIYS